MPDDLSPLKEPTFATALNDLDDLLTQSGKAFLIGAGCSKCAGLPLMAELTTETLASAKLSATTKTILSAIQGLFAGANAANIEDYQWDYEQTASGLSHFSDQVERQTHWRGLFAVFEMFYSEHVFGAQPPFLDADGSSCVLVR